jgi:hypothetical protein
MVDARCAPWVLFPLVPEPQNVIFAAAVTNQMHRELGVSDVQHPTSLLTEHSAYPVQSMNGLLRGPAPAMNVDQEVKSYSLLLQILIPCVITANYAKPVSSLQTVEYVSVVLLAKYLLPLELRSVIPVIVDMNQIRIKLNAYHVNLGIIPPELAHVQNVPSTQCHLPRERVIARRVELALK